MTDSETFARTTIDAGQLLAAELSERLIMLAALAEHPRTNARLVDSYRAEAHQLLEAIAAQLLTVGGGVHA